jgi:hypothetical protein
MALSNISYFLWMGVLVFLLMALSYIVFDFIREG